MIAATLGPQRTQSIEVGPVTGPASRVISGAPASLLPEPGSAGLDHIQDAMSMMYQVIAAQGQQAMSVGEIGVQQQTRAQQADAAQQTSALQAQEAEEAKSHTFLGELEALAPKIAEYVGFAVACVGAAALTVASCGAGSIAIAGLIVAMSATGMVASQTGCFGKDSEGIAIGCDVASSVLSFGASSALLATSTLQAVTAVGDGASGVADVVAGASTIATTEVQADVIDDAADVQQATNAMSREARMISDLVAGLKASAQSNQNALQVLAGASQTYAQALTLSAAGKA